jgi:hypothetical protein
MTRYRAALVHLGLSALVVGTVFVLVYFMWYPEPLFRGAGGRDLFLVLAFVDVTIGPLITLIIFRSGKWGLKFDLATIALLQIAALAYGTHVAFEARPVWAVYVKGRFDLIRANQVVEHEKGKPEFQGLSITGPRIAGARVPTDPGEQYRIATTALSGFDVSSYPQFFVPYQEVREEALARARPARDLRKLNPDARDKVDRVLASLGRNESEIAFVPMRAGKQDLAVLVDARTGDVLAFADLKPWEQ